MHKIDIHVHSSLDRIEKKINGNIIIDSKTLVDKMKRDKVEKSVLMSMSYRDEDEFSNHACKKIIDRYPDLFYYMATIDIEDTGRVESQIILEKQSGAIGIGELIVSYPIDHPKLQNLYKCCEQYNMPILFHMSPNIKKQYGIYDDQGLPGLEKMLKKYPKLIFIGHSQPFWYEISKEEKEVSWEERNSYPEGRILEEGCLQQLLRKHENLYCDLSANSGANAIMRDRDYGIKFIKEFSDRLFFGTDTFSPSQYFPLSDYLIELRSQGLIDDLHLESIFYKNFKKVFK